MEQSDILQAVYAAIEEVNRLLPEDRQLGKSASTILGGDGGLDSMGIINLVVALDSQLTIRAGGTTGLTDHTAQLMESGAFSTIGSLADSLAELLG